MSVTLSFDIGHASIGWCVLSATKTTAVEPDILGGGVVTFPTDDCLASQRRGLRRTRRHIRSTRQRIERIKLWLLYRGVLTRKELDRPGHPAPFLLAAAALQGHRALDAWELWTVLRWYAHNRGYDGNSRWANETSEEGDDDTKKEQAAKALMTEHGTDTMAETVCSCLGLKPSEHDKRISSFLPYKTLDAAYPRSVVEKEVGKLLSLHINKIPGFDAKTVRLLLKSSVLTKEEREELLSADIRLPKRYHAGLLFGQLVPRFDNRIIARCPITWAEIYDKELQAGKPEAEARHMAERNSKVPSARSVEFLEYRFARILANLRADGKPVPAAVRADLMKLAKSHGKLTANELDKEICQKLQTKDTNIDAFFKIHPDSEKALVVDPAAVLPHSNKIVKSLWPSVPESVREWALEQWKRNRSISPAEIIQKARETSPSSASAMESAIQAIYEKLPAKQAKETTFDGLLCKGIKADYATGRAPYAKPVLKRVVEEVLAGFDPNKPANSISRQDGEGKPANGVLYSLLDPQSRVRQIQGERPLDNLTNNHLVRHRLLILDRLVDDMVEEFCKDDVSSVSRVVVEVARELREF